MMERECRQHCRLVDDEPYFQLRGIRQTTAPGVSKSSEHSCWHEANNS